MANLDEEMNANALEAMKLTRKHFVVELDFSAQSIAALDNIADDVEFTLRGGCSDENIELLVRTWGSYLGEVIRRHVGGEWVRSEESGQVHLEMSTAQIDPQDAVKKRLLEEAKPSLKQFYANAGG